MKVSGKHFRTIWLNPANERVVRLIDQRFLPQRFVIEDVTTVAQMTNAIREMHVRGAGLIGAAAGYGMYLATFESDLAGAAEQLKATRPTAVNLAWAIDRQLRNIEAAGSAEEKQRVAFQTAREIADEDAEHCRRIGEHGIELIRQLSEKKDGAPVNILTHCNAGGLATSGYGTALGVVRAALESGKKCAVYADETRPWLQGARLTAWELLQDGIEVTLLPDVAAASLLASGKVGCVVVGADRIARNGESPNRTCPPSASRTKSSESCTG